MRIGLSAMWLHGGSDSKNSGLSRYAFRLIDEWARHPTGHEMVLFHPAGFKPPAHWKSTIDCHPVDIPSLRKRVAWEHFGASKEARRHRIEVWFSLAHALPYGKGFRKAVMIHDTIPLLFPQFHHPRTVLYQRLALRHATRTADLLLVNSHATKKDVQRLFGVEDARFAVTHLGPGNRVAPVERDAARARESGFGRTLLFVGNLEPRRNLVTLFRALELLRRRHPDLGLIVVGDVRPGASSGLEALETLGIADAVRFAGYVPDEQLPALFADADAFVLPTLCEGFGIPLLEAMALGAPAVVSDLPVLREVAGDAAATFDPHDPESLARAVEGVLSDENRAQTMRRKGFERAAQFSWERTAKETLDALERIKP